MLRIRAGEFVQLTTPVKEKAIMYSGSCCDPSQSVFAGMTTEQLQAALAAAQAAYIKLLAGGQGVSFSYTQGDGTRSVTYTAANPTNLAALILQLKQQLGIVAEAARRYVSGIAKPNSSETLRFRNQIHLQSIR